MKEKYVNLRANAKKIRNLQPVCHRVEAYVIKSLQGFQIFEKPKIFNKK